MSPLKKIITSLVLIAMVFSVSPAMALTFTEVVNLLQAPDINLPTGVTNPKGNIGFILSELFWGTADGTKNGKIKPQYLDYSGISSWTQSGTITYLTVSTGSVGIGTPNPGDYSTAIRGIDDTATKGALWVSGQTATTPGLMVRNDGNVGIGTASPAWPLHVNASIADWAVGIVNSNASGYGVYIKGGKADGTTQSLHIRNVDNITLFNILGNGNVGIGTASPTSKLHIIHSGSVTEDQSTALTDVGIGLRIQNATAGQVGIGTKNSVGGPYEGDFIVYNQWFNGTQYIWKERMRVRSDGNVGIGTTAPSTKLDIRGSGDTLMDLVDSSDANRGLLFRSGTATSLVSELTTNSANRELALGVDDVEYMRIKNNGNIGIGTTANTGVKFYIKGNGSTSATYPFMVVNSSGTNILYVNDGGGGYLGAAAWSYLSDRRLKEKITPLSYGLREIMKLDAKKFDYIKGEKNNLGFIAQDVQFILPELVTTQPTGMLGLKTDMMIPVLVNAMKEQQRQIERLTDEVRELKKR